MFEFTQIYAIAVVLIPTITNYIKEAIPKRFWAIIPFVLGGIVSAIWGSNEGIQIQQLLTDAFLVGGGATMLYSANKVLAPAKKTTKK